MSRIVPILVFIFLSFGGTACTSDTDPALGEWTLEEEEISLTEDLVVSETDSYYLGAIAGQNFPEPGPGVDVLSDGRMVVADVEAQHLKLLRPDGSLIDTLGGRGQGPGEFQRLGSVQVARGDSIYAYAGRRLTVFAPSAPHAVVRTVRLETDKMPPYRVLVTEAQLSALYGTPFMAGRDLDEYTWHPWRHVTETGMPTDTLFETRMQRMASVRLEGKRFSLYPMPFEQTMPVTTGPDGRLYMGHTDSLHVMAYQLTGASTVAASVPVSPVPVTEADRDSALADMDSGPMRQKVSSALPDTKPALTELVVADDGRLWIRRPPAGPNADMAPWWVLNPETKTILETHLPREVSLEAVQEEFAYGTTTTEAGAPAVVRYRVEEP